MHIAFRFFRSFFLPVAALNFFIVPIYRDASKICFATNKNKIAKIPEKLNPLGIVFLKPNKLQKMLHLRNRNQTKLSA